MNVIKVEPIEDSTSDYLHEGTNDNFVPHYSNIVAEDPVPQIQYGSLPGQVIPTVSRVVFDPNFVIGSAIITGEPSTQGTLTNSYVTTDSNQGIISSGIINGAGQGIITNAGTNLVNTGFVIHPNHTIFTNEHIAHQIKPDPDEEIDVVGGCSNSDLVSDVIQPQLLSNAPFPVTSHSSGYYVTQHGNFWDSASGELILNDPQWGTPTPKRGRPRKYFHPGYNDIRIPGVNNLEDVQDGPPRKRGRPKKTVDRGVNVSSWKKDMDVSSWKKDNEKRKYVKSGKYSKKNYFTLGNNVIKRKPGRPKKSVTASTEVNQVRTQLSGVNIHAHNSGQPSITGWTQKNADWRKNDGYFNQDKKKKNVKRGKYAKYFVSGNEILKRKPGRPRKFDIVANRDNQVGSDLSGENSDNPAKTGWTKRNQNWRKNSVQIQNERQKRKYVKSGKYIKYFVVGNELVKKKRGRPRKCDTDYNQRNIEQNSLSVGKWSVGKDIRLEKLANHQGHEMGSTDDMCNNEMNMNIGIVQLKRKYLKLGTCSKKYNVSGNEKIMRKRGRPKKIARKKSSDYEGNVSSDMFSSNDSQQPKVLEMSGTVANGNLDYMCSENVSSESFNEENKGLKRKRGRPKKCGNSASKFSTGSAAVNSNTHFKGDQAKFKLKSINQILGRPQKEEHLSDGACDLKRQVGRPSRINKLKEAFKVLCKESEKYKTYFTLKGDDHDTIKPKRGRPKKKVMTSAEVNDSTSQDHQYHFQDEYHSDTPIEQMENITQGSLIEPPISEHSNASTAENTHKDKAQMISDMNEHTFTEVDKVESESIQQKRKRGRPKKILSMPLGVHKIVMSKKLNEPVSAIQNNAMESTNQEVVSVVKKKRDRSPVNDTSQDEQYHFQDEYHSDTPIEQVENITKSSLIEPPISEHSNASTAENTHKDKAQMISDMNEHTFTEVNKVESESIQQKRKRGRPKKILSMRLGVQKMKHKIVMSKKTNEPASAIQNNAMESMNQEVVSIPEKKRGRPSKKRDDISKSEDPLLQNTGSNAVSISQVRPSTNLSTNDHLAFSNIEENGQRVHSNIPSSKKMNTTKPDRGQPRTHKESSDMQQNKHGQVKIKPCGVMLGKRVSLEMYHNPKKRIQGGGKSQQTKITDFISPSLMGEKCQNSEAVNQKTSLVVSSKPKIGRPRKHRKPQHIFNQNAGVTLDKNVSNGEDPGTDAPNFVSTNADTVNNESKNTVAIYNGSIGNPLKRKVGRPRKEKPLFNKMNRLKNLAKKAKTMDMRDLSTETDTSSLNLSDNALCSVSISKKNKLKCPRGRPRKSKNIFNTSMVPSNNLPMNCMGDGSTESTSYNKSVETQVMYYKMESDTCKGDSLVDLKYDHSDFVLDECTGEKISSPNRCELQHNECLPQESISSPEMQYICMPPQESTPVKRKRGRPRKNNEEQSEIKRRCQTVNSDNSEPVVLKERLDVPDSDQETCEVVVDRNFSMAAVEDKDGPVITVVHEAHV